MSKIADTKKKLAAIDHPGTKMLIVELLQDHDTDIGSYNQEAGPIGYGRYVEEMCNKLKGRYKQQLKRQESKVKNKDLEDMISEIKSGEIPEWVNMLEHKKKE